MFTNQLPPTVFAPATPSTPTPKKRTSVMAPVWPQHQDEQALLQPWQPEEVGSPQTGDMIRLRLLVIAADGNDTQLEAITTILDRLGAPYDIMIAAQERLTEQRLWSGAHAHYQGVFLATNHLGRWNEQLHRWESAFDAEEWQTLWRFEARFGIRQVALYTHPGGSRDDYGLGLINSADTTTTPLPVYFSTTGREIFWYLNQENPVVINSAWVYLTQRIDPNTDVLLETADGHAVAALRRYVDGREHLALTMAHNPHLNHTWLLGYGLVNWVTRGLFLGERHVYLSIQVDDIFNSNLLWNPELQMDESGAPYRLHEGDVDALVGWLDRLHRRPQTAELTLDMAFNGAGARPTQAEDTLATRLVQLQDRFRWINHGFTHLHLDSANYADSLADIQGNHAAALRFELRRYDADAMVTADVSGLRNPEFLRAARDAGIRYLVTDTSRPGWCNPSPNVGIVSTHQPEILLIPRRANNLFYDVSTPEAWVSKYNHIYREYWRRESTFEEILEREAEMILRYMLTFDIDPLMFHQPNLRAYDGTHSLLSDLIDTVLERYFALVGDVPICSLSMREIGQRMARRANYNAANVQAHRVCGSGIVLSADRDVVVPITGVRAESNSEFYAGQHLAWVTLKEQTMHWIPEPGLPAYASTGQS
jgi:hypothetical protein